MTEVSDQKMADHTVKAFDADLAKMTRTIADMGDLTEKQLKDAVDALLGRDLELAKTVIARDENNESMQRGIETDATLLIARRQPVAYDLRLIVAVWETAIELRRVGALAKNIASSVVTLGRGPEMSEPVNALRRLARTAARRLRDVVKSLIHGDADKAQSLWRTDNEIDDGLIRAAAVDRERRDARADDDREREEAVPDDLAQGLERPDALSDPLEPAVRTNCFEVELARFGIGHQCHQT